MVLRLLFLAKKVETPFASLILVGVATTFAFQVLVNIGMVTGIMPVTGLPLPFLSQGGSFYMAMALGMGIANSIWLMRTPVPTENQLI